MSTVESDYYAFMGFDPAHTRDVLTHYAPMFADAAPVLELACGRGEFLDLLRESGVAASGVDVDEGMVQAGRARGHDVTLGDALDFLDAAAPGTYGGIFAAHFVEHLQPDAAMRLVRAAKRALRPGGTFVLVTPNAGSLSILGYDFWKDPTHIRFYDPMLLRFFCIDAGFADADTGSNPRNDPGPPPHLHAPETPAHPDLTDEINTAVQRASGKRGAKHQDTDVGYLLGHLLVTMNDRLHVVEEALSALRHAHESLLRAVYPPNEVYVVAHA